MQDNIFQLNGALRSDYSDTGIFGALNNFAKRKEQSENGQEALSRFPAETPVAMAYVPLQFLKEEYEPTVAFKNGTLFPELNKPFMAGGMK